MTRSSRSRARNDVDLGTFLREARLRSGYSQVEVAKKLKLKSGQPVSDWERNRGSSIPMYAFKFLIKLYDLPAESAFDFLVRYHVARVKRKLDDDFYESGNKGA